MNGKETDIRHAFISGLSTLLHSAEVDDMKV
jgi:hypothetical protein